MTPTRSRRPSRTHFTVSGLEPETSVYVRVASRGRDARGADPERLDDSCHGCVGNAAASASAAGCSGDADGADGFPRATQTSITWTWNAVEGATGLRGAGRVRTRCSTTATTVMFDGHRNLVHDGDELHGERPGARIRPCLCGLQLLAGTPSMDRNDYVFSDFTTHVTGMSAMMPPPPPPAGGSGRCRPV